MGGDSSSEGLGIIVPFAIYTGAFVTIVGAHAVSMLTHLKVSKKERKKERGSVYGKESQRQALMGLPRREGRGGEGSGIYVYMYIY